MTSTEPTLWGDDDAELVPAVVVDERGGEVAPLAELAERARPYARSSKAANTLRAYESDLRHFGTSCEARGLSAFPAGYRKLGFDDTTDLGPKKQGTFEPVLRDIQSARGALHPVAYPDHIRLPEGHPLLALLAEQEEPSPPPGADSSPEPR